MNTIAAEFMRQNTWANLRLIEFCEGLDERVLDASAPGTYGAVRDTLVHMVASLGRYLNRLEGEDSARAGASGEARVAESKPWPGFDALRDAASRAGDALARVAAEAADDREVRAHFQGQQHERNGDWRIAASVLIVQAYNHCTDHRSQICTILTQAGIEPPEVDAWAWGDSTGRMSPSPGS